MKSDAPYTTENASGRLVFAAGAALAVLAAAPYPLFDLDRFFVPKELVLHAAALALALPLLRRARLLEFDAADLLLALYLLLGALGALLAPDWWLATRAMAVTLSGAAVFWAARAAGPGERRAIVSFAAAAAALAAALTLAQAYGLQSEFFSRNRVPGGTLGNRNFTAHIAAACLPALLLASLRARSGWAAWAGRAGMALAAAALVLTRSRTALLGLIAAAGVLAYGLWKSGGWKSPAAAPALRRLLAAAAVGALAALLLPNKLEWKSRSPYLDTVAGVVNYRTGSGHGRVIQYTRSLRIAAAHPVLGAGAGNWGVVYPKYIDGFDRSIDYATGRTMNPWPSSDWVAVLSERGLPALAVLLALFGTLFYGAWRRAAAGGDAAAENYALASTLAAAAVVGCFDAFLLLPAPAFLVWGLAGALAARGPALRRLELSPRARGRLVAAAAVLWGAALLRNSGQIAAMAVYSGARGRTQLRAAALLDPGNARIRARLEAPQGRPHAAQRGAPLSSGTTDYSLPPEQPVPEADTD